MKALRNIRKKINVAVQKPSAFLDHSLNINSHEYIMHKKIKCYTY